MAEKLRDGTLIWTYQDVVDQILDQWNVSIDDRNRRLARRAVQQTNRDLANRTR